VTAPRPPRDFALRDPLIVELPAGTLLHRFYTATYEPIFYDRGRNGRFNAPDGSYGVLYAAMSPAGAFAETFLREPGRTLLPADLLARKAYIQLRVLRPLRLVKLGGPGLARVGGTAERRAWRTAVRRAASVVGRLASLPYDAGRHCLHRAP
jgi:hypothetical protein